MSLLLSVNSFLLPLPPQSLLAEWDEEERHLLEMFPKCGLTEARSALCIARGDVEEAVRLIIEGDVQLTSAHLNVRELRFAVPATTLVLSVKALTLTANRVCVGVANRSLSRLAAGQPGEEHVRRRRPEDEGDHPGEVSWSLSDAAAPRSGTSAILWDGL